MTFTFKVPNLPKPLYELVRRASRAFDLTHRQVVIAALELLNDEGFKDVKRVTQLFDSVKLRHPRRARKVTGV